MNGVTKVSATTEDLLLTIVEHGAGWRAYVKDLDDPTSVRSDGMDCADPHAARQAAVEHARDLFGTIVIEADLEWYESNSPYVRL